MRDKFNLSEYMSNGVENIIKGIVKASFKNPKETAFILKYALSNKDAQKRDRTSINHHANALEQKMMKVQFCHCYEYTPSVGGIAY